MPIDAIPVGSNLRTVVTIGDSTVSSQYGAVLPVTDATNVTGKYGSLSLAANMLKDASGNLDVERSAPGTVGIRSVSTEGTKTTFSTASLSVTPAATATDIWTLLGSSTKIVRLLKLIISGLATAAATVDIQLIIRSTADSAGTATTPVLVANDSNSSAATAVVSLYSGARMARWGSMGRPRKTML